MVWKRAYSKAGTRNTCNENWTKKPQSTTTNSKTYQFSLKPISQLAQFPCLQLNSPLSISLITNLDLSSYWKTHQLIHNNQKRGRFMSGSLKLTELRKKRSSFQKIMIKSTIISDSMLRKHMSKRKPSRILKNKLMDHKLIMKIRKWRIMTNRISICHILLSKTHTFLNFSINIAFMKTNMISKNTIIKSN